MNVSRLQQADDELQTIIDDLLAKHRKEIGAVMDRLLFMLEMSVLRPAAVGSSVGGVAFADVVEFVSLRYISEALNESGWSAFQQSVFADYEPLLAQVMSKKYPHLADALGELGSPSLRAIRESMVDEDAVHWQRMGSSLATRIKGQLQQMTLAPRSVRSAAKLLATETKLTYSQAQTQVNTSLASLQRKLHMRTADTLQQTGEEVLFLYMGPTDERTRPFCKRLVGKVISRKQLAGLSNGSGLPVRTSAGGYNCRHDLVPVTKAFVKAQGLERLK